LSGDQFKSADEASSSSIPARATKQVCAIKLHALFFVTESQTDGVLSTSSKAKQPTGVNEPGTSNLSYSLHLGATGVRARLPADWTAFVTDQVSEFDVDQWICDSREMSGAASIYLHLPLMACIPAVFSRACQGTKRILRDWGSNNTCTNKLKR
jgi:hypothetical protein